MEKDDALNQANDKADALCEQFRVRSVRESVALALIKVGNIPVMDLVKRTEEISDYILYGTKKD